MDSDNFDNDSLIQNESEILPKIPMYEARLVIGDGGKQQQDVATKRNTPLTIDIHRFPIGILGQVWYLIVSITDLCTLTYSPFLFNKAT